MAKNDKTILIVDDSKVSRMMLRSQIAQKKPHWLILEAADALEALELAQNNPQINFFSIDYNMPGMNGLELVEKLQNSFPTSNMALLTANIQEEIFKRSMKYGSACFHKPISDKVINDLLGYFNG